MQTSAESPSVPATGHRKALWCTAILSLIVLGLWVFPLLWYNRLDPKEGVFWLAEQNHIDGWSYREVPVAKSAEAVLVADRLISGEFSKGPDTVQVFSAKRYDEKQNDIGLFVHTPDRCWTSAGWSLEAAAPDSVQVVLHGVPVRLERRIFEMGGVRELVYFGGLVGGQGVPYRLDHNLPAGLKRAMQSATGKKGSHPWALDKLFWTRVWQSFASRCPLLGPKQFIRISTPVTQGDIAAADALLRQVLQQWLQPVGYRQELLAWRHAATTTTKAP